MKYLDSIELLNYTLKKLKAGNREQVKTKDVTEVQQVIALVAQKLKTDATVEFQIAFRDLMEAFQTAQAVSAIQNLTDSMKEILVSGVLRMKYEVSKLAWDFYNTVEFEVTDQVIPLMRDVVETYLLEG